MSVTPQPGDHVRVTALGFGWQAGDLRVGETYTVEFVGNAGDNTYICLIGRAAPLIPWMGDAWEIMPEGSTTPRIDVGTHVGRPDVLLVSASPAPSAVSSVPSRSTAAALRPARVVRTGRRATIGSHSFLRRR